MKATEAIKSSYISDEFFNHTEEKKKKKRKNESKQQVMNSA